MTYGATTYGSAPYGSGESGDRVLYWAIQPSSTTNWPDNSTGAGYIAAGQDGTGAALPEGSYGSQPYTAAGEIDMLTAASGLTPGQSYEFGYTVYDAATETYSNVVVSAAWETNKAGVLAVTLEAATLAATGESAVTGGTGQLVQTLADAGLVAAGTLALSSALTQTLGDLTCSAAGILKITGVLGQTLAPATLVSVGVLVNPGTGVLAATLDSLTCVATGTVEIAATLGITLGDLVLIASGIGPSASEGVVVLTLGALTLNAFGYHPGTLPANPYRTSFADAFSRVSAADASSRTVYSNG